MKFINRQARSIQLFFPTSTQTTRNFPAPRSASVPRLACIFVCALSIFLNTGCGRHHTAESTKVRAYRLIDAQRTDEAIALIEMALDKDPGNYEYKVVLASAYAHKAGFRIQRLISVMDHAKEMSGIKDPEKLQTHGAAIEAAEKREIENKKTDVKPEDAAPNSLAGAVPPNRSTGKAESKENDTISQSQRVDNALNQINVTLNRFNAALRIYESIPSVRKDEVVYLQQAIEILNELGSTIKQPEALYRGALEIVLFKYILAENLIGDVAVNGFSPLGGDSIATSKDCRVNVGNLNDNVILLGNTLVSIFTDMAIANPKNGKDSMRLAESTAGVISQMTLTTTSLVALDDVSNVVFKQTILQNGFGKLIRCGGDGSLSQPVSPSGSGS